jgi:glutamyl-tRNA(Gln) amidotransferase subunit E
MSEIPTLNSLKTLDYKKLGLMCGLEIHQQLNTGKLFCKCPCEIHSTETLDQEVERSLRFSQSETGDVDKAALAEFMKKKTNVYKYNEKAACLVDLDEEPPAEINSEALDTALKIGKMMNLAFFDKVQVMRKLIIDGSITTGFQRTAMLGFGGYLETQAGRVEINGINIEEDSCRVIERGEKKSIFALDRQGIPLIEITTGPQIKEPQQAFELASQLGGILRSFPQTKRGLGSIRQDLNVSISGGARIEIKGAQNLKLIPEVIEAEVRRQMQYLFLLEEFKKRGAERENIWNGEIHDLSKIFDNTDSKVILDNLRGKSTGAFAVKLKALSGLLGLEMQENFRFASEVSSRNKQRFHSIKGLFHSDELPKYGIREEDCEAIEKELKIKKKEQDAYILLAGEEKMMKASLEYIVDIIKELLKEVPSEVRQVDPKGTLTTFLRPMPGAARMYPETDVPERDLSQRYIDSLELPELLESKLERLSKELLLDRIKLSSFLESYSEEEMKRLLELSQQKADILHRVLFEVPKDIKKRDNIEPLDLKMSLLEDLMKLVGEGTLNQRSLRDVFLSLYKDKKEEVSNLKTYLEEKGLLGEEMSDEDLEKTVKEVVEKNKGAPFGALMGQAMKATQGKVDGKRISEILKNLT